MRILVAIVTLLLAMPAYADLSDGIAYLQQKDFVNAVKFIQPEAEKGNTEAQFRMCGLYYIGQGVPKNDAEAFNFCKLAAEQGHSEAMYNLALFYQNGEGTQQNYNEAAAWYKRAADVGNWDAQFNYYQLLNAGHNHQPSHDHTNGLAGAPQMPPPQQYAPPAQAQYTPPPVQYAQPQIAYAPTPQPRPQPAPQQMVQAPAAPKPPTNACEEAERRGVIGANCFKSADLDALETASGAEPVEVDNLEKLAAQGNESAQFELAEIYRQGLGVPAAPEKAMIYYGNLANQGNANAMIKLGDMYKNGEGVLKNESQAFTWYNLAADRMQNGLAKDTVMTKIKDVSPKITTAELGKAMQNITVLDKKIPVR